MSAIIQAFKDADLRKKIFFTIAMIVLYRIGAQIPSPGVDYATISGRLRDLTQDQSSVYSLINLFSVERCCSCPFLLLVSCRTSRRLLSCSC